MVQNIKAQKLTDINKAKRVQCIKRLRTKFGFRKNLNKWKWNRVLNCDFSGLFPLQGFQNKRNDGVWVNEGEEVDANLLNTQTDKFQGGIVFWDAMSSQGLIPPNAPINVSEWLNQQRCSSNEKRKRIYLTSQAYAKFWKEKTAPAIKATFRKFKLNPIFHDDQDRKHRTKLVRNTIAQLFNEHVPPLDNDAKFADVWRI